MSFLTNEQKKSFGGLVNAFGYVLTVCVMIALAAKYIMSGYPPLLSFLEPLNEVILTAGAIAAGIVIYSNNKLIK